MVARHLAPAALACAVALGACGGDGGNGGGGTQATAPPERADRPAQLPAGWKRVVNRRAGFSVGMPPGWRARGSRGATVVRSGDRLLAVSIAADRSAEGRRLAPSAYARRTAAGLGGYRRLRVGRPVRVRGSRYRGASVTARGTFARTRVRQAIRVVALTRPGRVTYTLIFFRSARSPTGVYGAAIRGMIRTFRARPPVG